MFKTLCYCFCLCKTSILPKKLFDLALHSHRYYYYASHLIFFSACYGMAKAFPESYQSLPY